ncbi:MAG TPA: hypothetical protein VGV89_03180, partial [Thermoplasmata archaeon]|nr:hypothetical protein [Thermoplasmata archaeon]
TVPESAVRDASLTLYIPFRVATGNHTILANFTVSALLGNSFRGGTCAAQHGWSYRYCLRQAGGFVTETTWLLDVNAPRWSVAPTNPWVGVSNSSYNFTHCWSGYGCTYSVGGGTGTVAVVEHVSSWFNVTGMRSTHLYYLAMAFTLEASASESTSYSTLRGFSGTGLVNLSQPGGGIDVTSITVL